MTERTDTPSASTGVTDLETDLNYTRQIRFDLINKYANKKSDPEQDNGAEDDAFLRELLNDADRASLGRSRIKVEKSKSENQAEIAGALALLLTNPAVATQRMGNIDYTKVGPPSLPNEPTPEIVEGEFSEVTGPTDNFDSFSAKIKSMG